MKQDIILHFYKEHALQMFDNIFIGFKVLVKIDQGFKCGNISRYDAFLILSKQRHFFRAKNLPSYLRSREIFFGQSCTI